MILIIRSKIGTKLFSVIWSHVFFFLETIFFPFYSKNFDLKTQRNFNHEIERKKEKNKLCNNKLQKQRINVEGVSHWITLKSLFKLEWSSELIHTWKIKLWTLCEVHTVNTYKVETPALHSILFEILIKLSLYEKHFETRYSFKILFLELSFSAFFDKIHFSYNFDELYWIIIKKGSFWIIITVPWYISAMTNHLHFSDQYINR